VFLTPFSGIDNKIAPRELGLVSQKFKSRLKLTLPRFMQIFEAERYPNGEKFVLGH